MPVSPVSVVKIPKTAANRGTEAINKLVNDVLSNPEFSQSNKKVLPQSLKTDAFLKEKDIHTVKNGPSCSGGYSCGGEFLVCSSAMEP